MNQVGERGDEWTKMKREVRETRGQEKEQDV